MEISQAHFTLAYFSEVSRARRPISASRAGSSRSSRMAGGHGGRIVRIGGNSAAGLAHDACRVAFRRRHNEHGTSGSENRIQLAGNDDAFEASLHGDDVHVARHHHVRHLLAGRNGRKRTLGEPFTDDCIACAICSVAYKHEPGVFVAQNLGSFAASVDHAP